MFIDIALNITDKQFSREGAANVMQRSRESRVVPILVGLDPPSSRECIDLAREYNTVCTVGIHPTSSVQYTDVGALLPYIGEDVVVAVGECGLDYDRLEFADKASQRKVFEAQLDLRGECYYLHSRGCHRDFMEMISDYSMRGVVHSFTGDLEEAEELIRKGLYIGVNGCSVKTAEGVETLRSLPLSSLVIETDSPYCRIKKSYAGFEYVRTDFRDPKILRKRSEPCCVVQMAEVVSAVAGIDYETVVDTVLCNTVALFGDRLGRCLPKWE